MRLNDRIRQLLRLPGRAISRTTPRTREALTHVVILDGTMTEFEEGSETNCGQAYRLLAEVAPAARLSIRYEQGTQWTGWRNVLDVVEGRGMNRQIRRAYGFIASRYRPGDRIFLLGYSRGAYAVRSLAGIIDQVGLLQARHATERNIRDVYRHYMLGPDSRAAGVFARRYCHPETVIEMIGCWDTVKALGLRFPVAWRFTEGRYAFHNHHLGPSVKAGFHALALNESREAYTPVLWESDPEWLGRLEQVWFRGTHGDIGGHLGGYEAARPLANIPFVWLMQRAAECGLPLPDGWQERFDCDPKAPSVGTVRGFGKLFLLRRRRLVGQDHSESVHPTAWQPGGKDDAA